jgi:outer membrane protein assembly factor BamB
MTDLDTATSPTIGHGLAQHPFLYAGEWQDESLENQTMHVVRDGAVQWSYTMPHGEYGDATLLPNGNVIFSTISGAQEVDADKRIVWRWDADPHTEIHTCQPLDDDHVFIVLNAVPAKAVIIDRRDNHITRELVIPTAGTNPHMMFRHCRYTADGTFLIAHMDADNVTEYDQNGKVLWTVAADQPWAAVRLTNGNTLISGNSRGYVREVNRAGETTWEFNRDDAARLGLELGIVQQAQRLRSGNTLIANWCRGPSGPDADPLHHAQLIELSPAKELIWVLHQWNEPDLGPASAFHLLDEGPFELQQR